VLGARVPESLASDLTDADELGMTEDTKLL
jgi:hypothetical protein